MWVECEENHRAVELLTVSIKSTGVKGGEGMGLKYMHRSLLSIKEIANAEDSCQGGMSPPIHILLQIPELGSQS